MNSDEPINNLKTLPRFQEGETLTIRGVEFFIFECHHFGLSLMVTNLPDSLRSELTSIGAEVNEVRKAQE